VRGVYRHTASSAIVATGQCYTIQIPATLDHPIPQPQARDLLPVLELPDAGYRLTW
jgi:hypothetical protein